MIVFDLACRPGGHVFEAWFASTDAYEDQRGRGLVTCPICESTQVDKALMAPRIATGGRSGDLAPHEAREMLTKLAAAQAKVLAGSEHVGDRFASAARAIHEGVEPDRPIHGRATIAEAKALHEDGVPVMPLPLPVRPPGSEH